MKKPAVMQLEEIGITASKSSEFSEWYAQTVIKAELADYAPVKGLIVLRPDGYAIWEMLRQALDARFAEEGVRNGYLPVLIPEQLLAKEAEHFSGFNPEVFWVTHSGDSEVGDRLALRPTSETLAYSLYSKWIKSWRDLPLKINFWNSAHRAEIKSTKPFIRTSEFLWQEGHTVHAAADDAKEQVSRILDIYKQVVEGMLAIPVIAGRKSESEKFVGAVYTDSIEAIMPDGRALQMGTSHFLGQNFSKPFGVKFAARNNVEEFAWQTSWGVSWRLIGAMIMTHGDDKGLSLPPRVAPIQVVIVPVYFSKEQERDAVSMAENVEKAVQACGLRVHLDLRKEATPGFKYHDWELRGVPLRIEIGPKEVSGKKVRATIRCSGKKIDIPLSDISSVPGILDAVQEEMLDNAGKILKEMSHKADDYQSFCSRISSGGLYTMQWCGNASCESSIKDETGADIRILPFDAKSSGVCARCSEPSRHAAVFARGY